MSTKKNILALQGSASQQSSNLKILNSIAELGKATFDVTIWKDLSELPHFQTELTEQNTPEIVFEFRNQIAHADGVIICTPEYVFSIPSRLKNAIEWCVSTTVFSDKPLGLVVAAASGAKALDELKLIMKTVQGIFTPQTTWLIQGVKAKVNAQGQITDHKTQSELDTFVQSYMTLVNTAD